MGKVATIYRQKIHHSWDLVMNFGAICREAESEFREKCLLLLHGVY